MNEHLTFELTNESKTNAAGVTLHRIRAMRDVPAQRVHKGDLGGWVSSERLENGELRVSNDAWVSDNAQVFDDAHVREYARVSGNARIFGSALITDDARVSDAADVYGEASIGGSARVYGHAHVFDGARVGCSAQVYDTARVHLQTRVTGNARVHGDADLLGQAQVHDLSIAFETSAEGETPSRSEPAPSQAAWICDGADITKTPHCLMFTSLGPEREAATLFRTRDGLHALHLGSTDETLDTLIDEIEYRRATEKVWLEADAATQAIWMQQYRALKKLGDETASRWAEEQTPE